MGRRNYHVVPHGPDLWAVIRENRARATSLHPTQTKGVVAGRLHAINQRQELVTHRPNGQIRDSDSFGNDPASSRDKKH